MGYTAEAEIGRSISSALLPPENLSGYKWAEQNFVIDGRASSFAGDFTTGNVAFTRAPVDAAADNTTATIVLMAAVQSLKSTTAHAALSRVLVVDPGPAMWVAQSKDEGEIMFNDRILPSFRRSRLICDLLPEEERHKITRRQISFATMPFYLAWGGSEKKLQSKPVRWLFLDEPEQYPDMVKEAEDRTTTFWNSRTLYMGTPKYVGGILDREFRKGHQMFWRVFCMKCAKPMRIHWGKKCYEAGLLKQGGEFDDYGMTWKKDSLDPWYECEHCHHRHFDTPQVRHHFATEGIGEMINPAAANPPAQTSGIKPRSKLSFQWGSIVSPIGKSWRDLKIQYEEAMYFLRLGNSEFLREFVNKRLGEPFNEENYEVSWLRAPVVYNALDKSKLETHRFLLADVQKDCLYWICRAANKETGDSWLIEAGKVLDMAELREVQTRLSVPDKFVGVDCGYSEPNVFRECARYGWMALKGWGDEQNARTVKWKQGGKTHDVLCKPGFAVQDNDGNEFKRMDWNKVPPHIRKIVYSVPNRKEFLMIIFASQGAMDILDALMRGGEFVPKWEYPDKTPDDYRQHLQAAKRDVDWNNRGIRVYKWIYKKGKDHYLACERMCVVFMVTSGVLKASIGVPSDTETEKKKPAAAS